MRAISESGKKDVDSVVIRFVEQKQLLFSKKKFVENSAEDVKSLFLRAKTGLSGVVLPVLLTVSTEFSTILFNNKKNTLCIFL